AVLSQDVVHWPCCSPGAFSEKLMVTKPSQLRKGDPDERPQFGPDDPSRSSALGEAGFVRSAIGPADRRSAWNQHEDRLQVVGSLSLRGCGGSAGPIVAA